MGVTVHQGDPDPVLVAVTPAGFVEPGRDHRRGVVGHRSVQPPADRGRRGNSRGRLVGVGQDVGHGARHQGQGVHGGDLRHAFTAMFVLLWTAGSTTSARPLPG